MNKPHAHAPLYTVADLAALLDRKVSTIRSALVQRPWTLPPPCKVPGTEGALFLAEDVVNFYRKFRREPDVSTAGRPTLASKYGRHRAAEKAGADE